MRHKKLYPPHLETWMAKAMDVIKDRFFFQITMPGSHDSMTYGDCPVFRKAKTQVIDIYDSLRCGVRYFDIRIKRVGGHYRGHHGPIPCSPKLEDLVRQIRTFYKDPSHKSELCFLKFRFPQCIRHKHDFAIKIILTKLRDLILPVEAWRLTYGEIRKVFPSRCLFICTCDNLTVMSPEYLLDAAHYVWDPYHQGGDYTTPESLQKHLIGIYSKQRPTNVYCLTVLQWIMTGYFWKFWRIFSISFSIPFMAQSYINPYLFDNPNVLSRKCRVYPPKGRRNHNVIMLDGINCKGSLGFGVLQFIIDLNRT